MNKLITIKQNNFCILKIISLLFIYVLAVSCQHNDVYVVKSYEISKEWGYCILKNDKIIIKQSTIPTVSNSIRFKSQEDALKVGQVVADRIKNNLSPTVTKNDLVLLKIKV